MAPWAMIAAGYGAALAGCALGLRVPHRVLTASACIAYLLLALGAGTLRENIWVGLSAPAALLLGGYWLSGLLFHAPQSGLERWLLESDRAVFRAIALDSALQRAPLWTLELLEACYASVYLLITAGAIAAGMAGLQTLEHFWTLVLGAELACYVWLPWLRTRPPRALEPPGVIARRSPWLRRLNGVVLDAGSVQANTLPSGHVAGATAAALALLPVSLPLASVGLIAAAAIAFAATAGRYHYAVDCAAGALVAVLAWSVF